MNVNRLLLGGLVAGVICFFGDFLIHGVLFGEKWGEVMASLGHPVPADHQPAAGEMAMFFVFALAKGLFTLWIYAAIRTRFGAGPKTALIAGLTAWAGMILIPHFVWLNFPLFPHSFVMGWMATEGIPVLIGAFVGGWIYKE